MQIEDIRNFDGPSLFHRLPVLMMRLRIADDAAGVEALRSDRLPGYAERLLALLPGLARHRCSLGREGGFAVRLARGTYPAHVVEHVALELSAAAGIGVGFGRALRGEAPGQARVVVRYRSEPGMRHLLAGAVRLVEALQRSERYDPAPLLAETRRIVQRDALGPSTQAIVDAATARGIPWRRVGEGSLLRLGWGRSLRWVQTAVTSHTGLIAAEIAKDKALTKQLLAEAQVPVPRGQVVASADEAVQALQALRGPLVVKPLGGNHGRGCTLGVTDAAAMRVAHARAAAIDARVLVERQVQGHDHRLLVVGGRLVAASRREPAQVQGDGHASIAALIATENADPRRGSGHRKPLTRIRVDAALEAVLAAQGLALDAVPAAGQRVRLCDTANLSSGGTAADVTASVHPDVVALAERAARAVGLDVCGIDYIAPDITVPGGGAVLEVNAGPGLRMHSHPSVGSAQPVGRAIVDMLYPPAAGARPGRIPLVAITGTNGKTSVARMVTHILTAAGQRVGLACTDGIWIDGRQTSAGDMAGPASARSVLADPGVEAAVLETARGGIVKRGLGYDWADVGVVTNVRADHIGQDGLRTHADLVRVKALVAAQVKRGGSVVLNADDEGSASIAALPALRGRRLVWFSRHGDTLRLRRHIARGHTAFYVQDGWIVEAGGGARPQRLVALATLPATLGGLADFMVANALAACAAARALGTDAATVAEALQGFEWSANRGRANLFALRGGYVLLDYGHNTDAYEAVGALTARLEGYHVSGVVDMPGDRDDSVILEGARAAGQAFDEVILHRSHNPRGRVPGAVAQMICAEIARSAPECGCVIEHDEASAAERALAAVGPGRFVALFYERYDVVAAALERHGARPARGIAPRLPPERERRWQHHDAFGIERRAA